MEAIKYLRGQLKLHGVIDKALKQAIQLGSLSTDADKTTRLAIEKVCSTVEELQKENAALKKMVSDQQQSSLF